MLKLENISFKVGVDGSDLEIIDNISLEIPDGSFTVITGPNGGGKSTLARLIMGIEKPTEGRILFNGEDITSLSVTREGKEGHRLRLPAAAQIQGPHRAPPAFACGRLRAARG